ncbi:glucosyl-3-phosphoglycerate synthase [Desulfatitalea alkaliphila]|uniref:Glucosyl-3-phosphoglycerate synthase n=1 Tax=Desulfatitalea alkaliphila TaxID=2929485 RepID=A0AA41R1Z7_9BACT|nr:glucosyl-3-phosphoglycerate synthase [Desulfatitalea alkaliphila]MCJ8500662.1 glucosyl-3-phosphoglycerate synthase [Desulfatitalea alkaliphila]
MDSRWMRTNTFHYADFNDLQALVEAKRRKGLSISLCLPTLNEEKTIAKEIVIVKSELMSRFPLVDEIVVIDSDSTDHTRDIARAYGADVHKAAQILPHLECYTGKGENLWKALFVTRGDIIVYLDADIKNIHHRFVYGLVGPLLLDDRIRYTKAFYDRPIASDDHTLRPTGGGRVTELVIRPLFSLFFPELTQILQPLSGEYAGYRAIFEQIPFPIGYGVETSMILDIYQKWGLEVIGQVDLEKRIHRNQDTKALGKMAFAILKTFIHRKIALGMIDVKGGLHDEMIQYTIVGNRIEPDIVRIKGVERPPMIEVPEYRAQRAKMAGDGPHTFRNATPQEDRAE